MTQVEQLFPNCFTTETIAGSCPIFLVVVPVHTAVWPLRDSGEPPCTARSSVPGSSFGF